MQIITENLFGSSKAYSLLNHTLRNYILVSTTQSLKDKTKSEKKDTAKKQRRRSIKNELIV